MSAWSRSSGYIFLSMPTWFNLSYKSDESSLVQAKKLSDDPVMFSLFHDGSVSLNAILRRDLYGTFSLGIFLKILKFQLRKRLELPWLGLTRPSVIDEHNYFSTSSSLACLLGLDSSTSS